jgi:hypothetical protein
MIKLIAASDKGNSPNKIIPHSVPRCTGIQQNLKKECIPSAPQTHNNANKP